MLTEWWVCLLRYPLHLLTHVHLFLYDSLAGIQIEGIRYRDHHWREGGCMEKRRRRRSRIWNAALQGYRANNFLIITIPDTSLSYDSNDVSAKMQHKGKAYYVLGTELGKIQEDWCTHLWHIKLNAKVSYNLFQHSRLLTLATCFFFCCVATSWRPSRIQGCIPWHVWKFLISGIINSLYKMRSLIY